MLENLNDINWNALKCAGGNASQVPNAVQGLISKDARIRNASYWQLDNHVVVQSTVYEAAFYVIPFLLEILSSDIKQGREEIYELLYEIGNGSAHSTDNIQDTSGTFIPLQKACRVRVISGIELYINEIRDKLSEARVEALLLLASFEEMYDVIHNTLEKIYANEQNKAFRKELLEVIKEIASFQSI